MKALINEGITACKGFLAAGAAAGIKTENRQDMAMIFSELPCACAGVYTTNLVKAAPVKWDREITSSGKPVRAVIVNSGVANACTGAEGLESCRKMAAAAAGGLGLDESEVLVASTGVIGRQLPMDRIEAGAKKLSAGLGADAEHAMDAARAIMTTDTRPKVTAYEFELSGTTVHIAGMCKGSGMIHPNMCTMLCFVATDAAISHECLQKALSADVQDTFNMISVDGDTSTNDTVLVLANGAAGNPAISAEGEDYDLFCSALHQVMLDLSKKIAGDGEGCTCLLEARVTGAADKDQARTIAKSVICSSLTKAAVFGHDANWGRILCAMGYSGAQFDPDNVDIEIESKAGRLTLVEKGVAADYSEEKATEILSEEEIRITMELHMGCEEATAFGCDLTYDYVRINGDYRS